ncbi:uncharacterized protein LOC109842328 [Asparagus officinalis]|uniref:uncharacterized protein LOC109842328 n=1 Tax=Asparagus officinalis TaxID=4686 RepID=UPI00098E2356|nr:uncharacterized protein LOC109842328 [Asparagus officinalis]
MRWYWGITRRWITRDPQPLAGHMPRPPTDSYIPSGMNERDYVRVLDSIDADIDAHVTEIQDQVALGLISRIKKSIAQVFHKTHVDEFAGREDRSRSFGQAYARRRQPRDDDADTSHADGADTSHADDAGIISEGKETHGIKGFLHKPLEIFEASSFQKLNLRKLSLYTIAKHSVKAAS